MDRNFDSPIFNKLIELNPWADRLWQERNELVRAKRWNVNALNQGGNEETRAWLHAFLPARSEATLSLIKEPADAFAKWAIRIGTIAAKVFENEDVAAAWPGSPMTKISKYGSLVNVSSKVDGYSIGQFKADFLLLSQSSLCGLEITDALDISRKVFPIGLDCSRTHFIAPFAARETRFGPFSDFDQSQFMQVVFAEAHFAGVVSFTIAQFIGLADFSDAVFRGPTTFTAVSFQGPTDFSGAQFRDYAGFEGAVFKTAPSFNLATFEGRTSFADATFHESATFDGASFPGRVYVGRIPKRIRDRIVKAHHPE